MTRASLFRAPCPRGWQPAPGERVIVAPPLRRCEAVVKGRLLDGFLEIELNWGGWKRRTTLVVDDLRPMPAGKRRRRTRR